jgi:acyl carrier protein
MALPSSNGLSQQVYATLGDYLRREPETLHPEDSLRDDLGLDSLQTIELVYQVESTFDIQIPDEDFGRLRTIGDVVTYLGERLGRPLNHVAQSTINTKTKKTGTSPTTKSKPVSRSKATSQ